MSFIWINCILFNGNDSLLGEIARKHYSTFMKELTATLHKEYSSKLCKNAHQRIEVLLGSATVEEAQPALIHILVEKNGVIPKTPEVAAECISQVDNEVTSISMSLVASDTFASIFRKRQKQMKRLHQFRKLKSNRL